MTFGASQAPQTGVASRQGQTDGPRQGTKAMAKGMDKRKKDVKKPKKEQPKPAIATPSTKSGVVINGTKPKG